MNVKRAFTLIEILIVIVIIGIIMGMTMNFGGEKIIALNEKTIQETYLDNLNIIQNHMLTSNYYEGKKFERLTLTFKEKSPVKSEFIWSLDNNKDNRLQLVDQLHSIEKLGISGPITLEYIPYQFGCEIMSKHGSDNTNNIKYYDKLIFKTRYKKKETCYQVSSATCKYRKINCIKILN